MIDGYIKRSDALELTVYQSIMGLNMAQTKLREMPGEDVRPVVHGHWIVTTENFAPELVCSVCGVRFPYIAGCCMEAKMHYCPNCGAIMDEEEEE